MNENDVRKIVQQELASGYRSGAPKVARHEQNGVDNVQIPQSSIIYPNPVNGTIDMAQETTYTLFLTGKGQVPHSVTFYGGALNIGAGVHAMIVGSAQFGANQQFQPSTTTSVTEGPVITNIIQGSASMTVINGASVAAFLKNSQGHIVYAEYPSGTLVAVANVHSVSNSQIQIKVIILASGWKISGLWTVV